MFGRWKKKNPAEQLQSLKNLMLTITSVWAVYEMGNSALFEPILGIRPKFYPQRPHCFSRLLFS
jgi:hypothetical protein